MLFPGLEPPGIGSFVAVLEAMLEQEPAEKVDANGVEAGPRPVPLPLCHASLPSASHHTEYRADFQGY